MPDPDLSINIVVIIDKPCWKKPLSEWEALIRPAILETLRQALWLQGVEINVLLTDNSTIQQLNKTHLGQDKPTNVLSFPSLEPEAISNLKNEENGGFPIILGDIALAFETIQQESLDQKKLFEHHLLHLIVHGILHLLGFDHTQDEDALVMESLEIKVLSSLMIPNPYEQQW
jgi:probable rRNA maturation factor